MADSVASRGIPRIDTTARRIVFFAVYADFLVPKRWIVKSSTAEIQAYLLVVSPLSRDLNQFLYFSFYHTIGTIFLV